MSLLLKGLIVGFCLAAPVGPIAALCVQRTISRRLLSGLVSGLGAAVADAVYGAVAAFGATMVSEFLISERTWMQRIGGVILIFMGLRLFLAKPAEEKASEEGKARGLTGDFLSTLFLTLTNPMTFVAFAAVFTTMGIGAVRGHPILTTELVGGVFLGSALWWLILCAGAHALRHHFDYHKLTVVNRGTGIFVIGVGLVYLVLSLRASPTPPDAARILPRPDYSSNPMLACVPSQNGLFPDAPQRQRA